MPHEHLIHDSGKGARPWNPLEPPPKADFVYLGEMVAAFERELPEPRLTVVVTTDHRQLPRYGEDVVVIQRAGPPGQVPAYARRVLTLFKTHSPRPALAARPFREPAGLTLVSTLAHAQVLARAAPNWLRRRLERVSGSPPAVVEPIPMGLMWPPPGDGPPVGERPVDLLFNGSVQTGERRGVRRHLGAPKVRSREAMVAAVRRLQDETPRLAVELALTPSFRASKQGAVEPYWERLMRAKLCLAPRGDTLETYRVFEAARAGCVVIGERLPRTWFYDPAPIVDQTGWGNLGECVRELLSDGAALAEHQRRTISWWHDFASPAAVGRRMAGTVRAALEQRPADRARRAVTPSGCCSSRRSRGGGSHPSL